MGLEQGDVMEKKSNHKVNVVRLGAPRTHTNADSLELYDIPNTSYQVVTKKGQFAEGQLAIYIQPDSVIPASEPFRFIWEPYQVQTDPQTIVVPEKRRRITVRKFRGEYSEGLLMPVTDFPELYEIYKEDNVFVPKIGETTTYTFFNEGDDVSDKLGITHYDPDVIASTKGENSNGPRHKYPKTIKGWFFFILYKLGFGSHKSYNQKISFSVPTYDVEALKNYKNAFIEGETVIVTEKIHGSNARYVCVDGVMYAGSRNLWKSENSPCVWRKVLQQLPWVEEWCRANEGYVLYGEVVPTQGNFNYGCKNGEVNFFVFDVRDPDGNWLEWDDSKVFSVLNWVPLVGMLPYNLEAMKSLVDGTTFVKGADHQREGIVIHPITNRHVRGVGRLKLKLVSNSFLEKDSK